MGDTCFGHCLPAQDLMVITRGLSFTRRESLLITHKYMFILLNNSAHRVICVSGSLGNSFDMLVQNSDSQSQWRHCMLVPLRGVAIGSVFQRNQKSIHSSLVFSKSSFPRALIFLRMNRTSVPHFRRYMQLCMLFHPIISLLQN